MRFIPKIGSKVICKGRFSGAGTVTKVRVLRFTAFVRWPSGIECELPLEDLLPEPEDAPKRAPLQTASSSTAAAGSQEKR